MQNSQWYTEEDSQMGIKQVSTEYSAKQNEVAFVLLISSCTDLRVVIVVVNSALIRGAIWGKMRFCGVTSSLWSGKLKPEGFSDLSSWVNSITSVSVCVRLRRLKWSQSRKTNANEDESEVIRPPTSDSTPTWGDLWVLTPFHQRSHSGSADYGSLIKRECNQVYI